MKIKMPFYQPPGLTPCGRVKDALLLGVLCLMVLTGHLQIFPGHLGRV